LRIVPIPDSTKWKAVCACDGAYDGLFFYAVRTTMIYCRPSCKSRTPVRSNVSFYADRVSAEQSGYRPCKRCRPDLLEPPGDDAVRTARSVLEKSYTAGVSLDDLAREVGMSKYHLQRQFKGAFGMTPAAYLTELRLAKAARLLANTGYSVTRIALDAGYRSVSHFTARFRDRYGCSPTAYRVRRAKDGEGAGA